MLSRLPIPATLALLILAQVAIPSAAAEESFAERVATLQDLGRTGRYAEMESGARALVAEAEELHPASLREAQAQRLLALALRGAGKTREPQARLAAQRAIALHESLLGDDDLELAHSLDVLVSVLRQAGRLDEAVEPCERALEIARRHHGSASPETGRFLYALAALQHSRGRVDEARSLYEETLALYDSTVADDDPRPLNPLVAYSVLLMQLRDLDEALKTSSRALDLMQATGGPEHPLLATALSNRATILVLQRDHEGALRLYRRAIRLLEEQLGADHPQTVNTRQNIARELRTLGRLEEARDLLRQVVSKNAEILGGDHPWTIQSWSALGTAYRELGDWDAAQQWLGRALEGRRRTAGESHPDTFFTTLEYAELLARSGAAGEARDLLRPMLGRAEASLGGEHPIVVSSLYNLGRYQLETGQVAAARRDLERSLALRLRLTGPEHLDVAQTRLQLADVALAQGRRGDALSELRQAMPIFDTFLRTTLASLPERRAMQMVAFAPRPDGVLFAGLLDGPEETADRRIWLEAAWDWILSHRGRVLEELVARRQAATDLDSEVVQAAWADLAAARQELAALWVSHGDGREDLAAALRGVRQRKEQAERRLAAVNQRFRDRQRAASTGLTQVRDALPANSALVEIVRVRQGDRRGQDLALVLRPDGELRLVDLGPQESLDEAVAAWRLALQQSAAPALAGEAGSLDEVQRQGRRLHDLFWRPIAQQIGEAETVYLVPDGPIHQVDLRALPTADGRFLVEAGPRLHLLSTGRDLVRFRGAAPATGRGLLAVGNPDFDASREIRLAQAGSAPQGRAVFRGEASRCTVLDESRWQRLPDSEREVRKIGAILRESLPAGPQKDEPVELLLGAAASEEGLKSRVAGKRILHLATHGFFLQDRCASEVEGLQQRGGEGSLRRETAGDSPLLLSGLVLAGANRLGETTSDSAEDGLLTAEELAALPLEETELAVLSACDTGRGAVAVGEGVFGLRRALELAGVRTVVMSLWPVPDRQARRWMERFYALRLEGADYPRASREASLRLLETLRQRNRPPHPYLWAGFVAAGAWE